MDISENPLQAAATAPPPSASSSAAETSAAPSSSEGNTAALPANSTGIPPAAYSAFSGGAAEASAQQKSAGYDEESGRPARGAVARLKGMSPSNSQQLELDDALASTAELDGPCADKQAGCAALCASCLHCCGKARLRCQYAFTLTFPSCFLQQKVILTKTCNFWELIFCVGLIFLCQASRGASF